MKRRPNGSGTVYKLKGARSRPWTARVSAYDANGMRVWRTLGYFTTKTEAQKALLKIDELPTRFNVTFEKVYEEWAAAHYKRIDPRTEKNYRSIYRRFVPLYRAKFSQLRTSQLQRVIDQIAEDAPGRVGLAKALLSQLYSYALKNDICSKDYAAFIELPRREKAQKGMYSDAEILALKKNATDTAKMLLMLIYSGMRINEMLSLTVFDVDINARIITGGEKTESGKNRHIPIHTATLTYWQEFLKSAKGGAIFDINYQTFRKRVLALQEDLSLPRRTIHETRHTCASLLAREGVPPVMIQKILGHSDYSMTANVYTHIDKPSLVEAINRI